MGGWYGPLDHDAMDRMWKRMVEHNLEANRRYNAEVFDAYWFNKPAAVQCPPPDIRKPDPEPIPFELLRSRTIHTRTATHDVYERYEPVGGMLILMSVERVPW